MLHSVTTDYVDCSDNNELPNVGVYARAGHDKLAIKSTEGTSYHWYQGEAVATQCHEHGLRAQYYHWLRPDSAAKAQADYFVSNVEKTWRAGDELLTDFEATYNQSGDKISDGSVNSRADALETFQARVAALLQLPLVYTGNWYIEGKSAMQAACRRYKIVISDYDDVAKPPNPYGLHYVAWQYTETATVAGFVGHVDYNRLLVPDPAPTPTPAIPIGDANDMKILEVSKSDCKKKGKTWPGDYLLLGNGTLEHISTVAKLRTYRAVGVPQQTISYAQYVALGGK